ncbi:MAG: hypothetical protein ACJA2P_002535 [Rhodoferax sp.]
MLANLEAALALFDHALNAPDLSLSTAQAVQNLGASGRISQYDHVFFLRFPPQLVQRIFDSGTPRFFKRMPSGQKLMNPD